MLFALQACDLKYGYQAFEQPTVDGSFEQVTLQTIENRLSKSPDDPSLLKRKVNLLNDLQWPQGSLPAIKKAIEISPKDGELFFNKARFHIHKDQLQEAKSACENASALGFLTADYFELYSQTLLQLGLFDDALNEAQKFKKLDPDNYKSHLIQGKVHFEMGDSLKAVYSLQNAFNLNKRDEELNLNLINLYLSQKDTLGYERILNSISLNDPNWKLKVALIKQDHGLLAESLSDLRALASAHPDYDLAQLYLIDTYYNSFMYDSAIVYSQYVINSDSLNLKARITKARSYDKKYFYQSAITEYQNLLAIDSTYENAAVELNSVVRKVAYLRRLKEEKEQPSFDLRPRRNPNN